MKTIQHFLYRYRVLLTLLAVLAILLMIFWFSSQTAEQSTETSSTLTDFAVRLFFPQYDSMTRSERAVIRSRVTHYVRKAAHFSEFTLLGFFWTVHFTALFSEKKMPQLRHRLRYIMFCPFLCGILCAAADEFRQKFSEGRSPEFRDFCIDAAGVLTGILLMRLLAVLIAKVRKRKKSPELSEKFG